jgi:hypothetical protein
MVPPTIYVKLRGSKTYYRRALELVRRELQEFAYRKQGRQDEKTEHEVE